MAEGNWPLAFVGNTGSGKSCLAALIFKAWHIRAGRYSVGEFTREEQETFVVRGGTCVWRRTDQFLEQVVSARMKGSVTVAQPSGDMIPYTESGLISLWRKADLCVLDDIGTSEPGDRQYSVLLTLLDSRVGKPLILTSNKSADELREIYDDRIVSRLGRLVIPIQGPDRRQEV